MRIHSLDIEVVRELHTLLGQYLEKKELDAGLEASFDAARRAMDTYRTALAAPLADDHLLTALLGAVEERRTELEKREDERAGVEDAINRLLMSMCAQAPIPIHERPTSLEPDGWEAISAVRHRAQASMHSVVGDNGNEADERDAVLEELLGTAAAEALDESVALEALTDEPLPGASAKAHSSAPSDEAPELEEDDPESIWAVLIGEGEADVPQ